jgi:hypothetical protein
MAGVRLTLSGHFENRTLPRPLFVPLIPPTWPAILARRRDERVVGCVAKTDADLMCIPVGFASVPEASATRSLVAADIFCVPGISCGILAASA